MSDSSFAIDALGLLRKLTGDSQLPNFAMDQLGVIRGLVDDSGREYCLVQRTGWGKSAVYFIATRLMRDAQA